MKRHQTRSDRVYRRHSYRHRMSLGRSIAEGGLHIVIVALARRLAGILFAVWRDGTTFRAPGPLGGGEVTT
jgi:hypothetical protein